MMALTIGPVAAILGALCHTLVVRWLPDRLRLPSVLAIDAVAFAVVAFVPLALGWSVPVGECLVAFVTTLSLGAAYTILFTAVAYDSPTLVLIETILDYGHAGMPIEAVDDFSVRHPFVSSRLVLLVSARIIDDDGQSLRFRGRIGLLLWVSDAYRRLCGRQTATG